MNLLIAILLYLGLHASPDQLNDVDFQSEHQAIISEAQSVLDENRYVTDAGGGVIDIVVQ